MINFAHEKPESDKTDITYSEKIENNHDFLSIIFPASDVDVRPIIASFSGSPSKVQSSKWLGKCWTNNDGIIPETHNNYFTLSCYTQNESGKYARNKAHFYSLNAIMLDDVGTKVSFDALTLQPSWLLETSPKNYQAGYILKNPIKDPKVADTLMNAVINAGLCDKGANGPRTRYARLPFGINGKSKPRFSCNLEMWQPENRFDIDDIINGFSLQMSNTTQSLQYSNNLSDIFVPCAEENPVISAFKKHFLYKTNLGNGKHDITCPWVSEHTGSIDSGTAYFEPDGIYPTGGFKCLHGHCEKRHIRDVLQHFCIEPKDACMKAIIRCVSGEMHKIVEIAQKQLALSKKHYQRGGQIVSVITDPATKETSIKCVSQQSLTLALSAVAQWENPTSDGKWKKIDPPPRIVSALHDSIEYEHMPILNGIAHQPYLGSALTIVQSSGYDADTGVFGSFDSKKFPLIEKPTIGDASDALALIIELLSEFSFADEVDKAAAVSAILTATIRPSLNLAPMYHVRAPQISSGKSFLCQIIGAFASARRGAPTSFPHDDEECRKLLLSELLRSPAVIEFDNLTSDLMAHNSLCTALTSEFLTERILGVSKSATVSTRTLFLSSGNNVSPVKDMMRRCITINLDPACESPTTRIYKKPNILTNLISEREKYVSASLTIVQAWLQSQRPKTDCKALSSFSEWSDLCRQPLLWLGLPDPATSLFQAMVDDPERDTLGKVLHAWHNIFQSTPKMIRDVIRDVELHDNDELREIFYDIASERHEINRRILGHWIKRNSNRIVNGFRFIPAGGSRSAAAWRVEKVKSV